MCNTNVERKLQAGSTEQWQPIPGYGNYYEVSNQGRVRSVARSVDVFNVAVGKTHQQHYRGQLKSISAEKNGLLRVKLNYQGKRHQRNVARLVASAFVDGEQPGYSVGYIDGGRSNCNSSNLYWYNRKGNPLFGKAMAAGREPVLLIAAADLPSTGGVDHA